MSYILNAFCATFGIQARDLGEGTFYSKVGPNGGGPCSGPCIYDVTAGSLRLTERLAQHFTEVLEVAAEAARNDGQEAVAADLARLREAVEAMTWVPSFPNAPVVSEEGDWNVVIAEGEPAIYLTSDGPVDVVVLGFRYSPKGLMYDLEHHQPGVKWTVAAAAVEPLQGMTRLKRVNLVTGEEEAVGAT